VNIPALISAAVLAVLILAARRIEHQDLTVKPTGLFRNWTPDLDVAHPERGSSVITDHLAAIVLGVVLLVAMFAALTTVGDSVITLIKNKLGL
jgi:hypothetical protein